MRYFSTLLIGSFQHLGCGSDLLTMGCEGILCETNAVYAFTEGYVAIRGIQISCYMRPRAKDAKFNQAEKKRPV